MVLTGQAGGVHGATAAAGDAEAVSLVDQEYGVVRSSNGREVGQRRRIAEHAEDRLGHHHRVRFVAFGKHLR